ncbi:DUF2218 domain-containing protein (plasmid) [Shinella sp. H4-D48]|uniref:DUF2218 domain-containing protein n=1 Tax=Shinella sp. H4-D48 TaxID=2925841 RepID=UPI001F534255|nr:DUF2218 domain-containing protein [Shinella sp. H4-D48]UNK40957.1 DUF2218 domain-containing protein [Shinella sp. H4-D48]
MIRTTAVVKTEFASKYLVQMCKHFAHKVDVEYTDTHGECRFDNGIAMFDADAACLHLAVEGTTEEAVTWAQSVLESHLLRFAFREHLEGLAWHRSDGA